MSEGGATTRGDMHGVVAVNEAGVDSSTVTTTWKSPSGRGHEGLSLDSLVLHLLQNEIKIKIDENITPFDGMILGDPFLLISETKTIFLHSKQTR